MARRSGAYSTNYFNTFIEAAQDCGKEVGTVPPERERPTVAGIEYRRLAQDAGLRHFRAMNGARKGGGA